MILRTALLLAFGLATTACGGGSAPASPIQPATTPTVVTSTLAAPGATTPTAGQRLTDFGATLTVANAKTTGTVSSVKYRFEWSESDSFPSDSRTGSKDNVDQGGDTTSYAITDTLKPNFKYYWRARAYNDSLISEWSATENFLTANRGFQLGQTIYDPLTDGRTVGAQIGGTFLQGQGWRADGDSDGIDYTIPTCTSCTIEFDVTNFGKAQGAPVEKDYKWISMGDGSKFGDFLSFRDHVWKMHLEQRSDGNGTGMKVIWRNGANNEGGNPGDHMIRNDNTVDWRADVVYHFTLRWTISGYSITVGTVNADGAVSGNQTWFQDGFGGIPYSPPSHRISLGTRSRSETMRGAIWRNFKVTTN